MADTVRSTQSLLIAATTSATGARSTQSLVLALSTGGASRATQSLTLALTTGGAARSTQSLVLVLAPRPAPARSTQSLDLTLAATNAAARATQSALLVMRSPPPPVRLTQGVLLTTAATAGSARATQDLLLTLSQAVAGAGGNNVRATQSLVLAMQDALDRTASRATQSLVLALMDAPCPADISDCGELTFRRLKLRTMNLLAEDPDFPAYWGDDEVGRLVNDAYRALAIETKAYVFRDEIDIVAGMAEYDIDERIAAVTRVIVDGGAVNHLTRWEMDRTAPGWETAEGRVYAYSLTDTGVRLMDAPVLEEDLEVWGWATPTDLVNTCDTPVLPAWSHQAVAYGAAARGLAKYGEQRSDALSGAYRGIYGAYRDLLSGVAGG